MEKTDENERALIEQAKHDREAFGQLYELYVDRIYNYVYYRTGNSQEAEDLTARIFFRAIQHIGRYEDRGAPFSAWLYRIARNMLANWYRDNDKRKMIPLDNISQKHNSEGPELNTEREQEREVLLSAIRRLPAARQELLILKYVEQMPNAEIGQIMGRSEGAIKSLYHRTLLSLRDEMSSTGG
ncbi:MAG TPA: RNA polymerase subunit sigma-24 [Chloroflexi bacterium]|jgi:RNA polymerase sigma-70 factor (ECF subfamily)|nr:RNA polymerase subunit sigma-24 [Chloroflexota bacterium]